MYAKNGSTKVISSGKYKTIKVFFTKDRRLAMHPNLERPYLFTVTQVSSGLGLHSCRDWEDCISFMEKVKNLNWEKKYLNDSDLRKYAEVAYKINNSAEKRRCDRVKGKENAINQNMHIMKDVYKYNKKLIDNFKV